MNLTSSATALQRNHSANALPTQTLMRKIQVSHLAVATSGTTSFVPAPSTTSPSLAKAISSFTYMRHQFTAMTLTQGHVRGDANFQGVERRLCIKVVAWGLIFRQELNLGCSEFVRIMNAYAPQLPTRFTSLRRSYCLRIFQSQGKLRKKSAQYLCP